MNFAFYEPKEGVEPTMGDYMDEIEVFVKEPLEIVHEVLANLWEQGILGDSAKSRRMADAGPAVVKRFKGTLARTLQCMEDRKLI